MPSNPPIACSLAATEMSARLAEFAALGRAGLVSADRDHAHAVLRFRANDDLRRRLAALVAAESECCAFLSLRVREESDAVVLTVDGPADAEPVVRDLVAAFDGAS